MVWNKELREEHFVMVAKAAYHFGPYLFLLTVAIGAFVKIGWIDIPAAAADVKVLEQRLEQVQRDVEDVGAKVDEATVRQKVIETEVKNTNHTLEQVLQQLNLLINNGLNGRRDR